MRMLQRSSRGFTVVFEDENVFEATILLEIDDAIAKGPENIFDAFLGHIGEGLRVIRCLDDYFMSADAVHAVVHAVGSATEVPLDSQCRILVGHNAHRPARFISFTMPMAEGEDLRRRLCLVAGAEGAKSALKNYGMPDEITWSARAIGRDDDPASCDGVLPQLGQLGSFP